jgi:hypothetical protein
MNHKADGPFLRKTHGEHAAKKMLVCFRCWAGKFLKANNFVAGPPRSIIKNSNHIFDVSCITDGEPVTLVMFRSSASSIV